MELGFVAKINRRTTGITLIVEEEAIDSIREEQLDGKETGYRSAISDEPGRAALQLQENRYSSDTASA